MAAWTVTSHLPEVAMAAWTVTRTPSTSGQWHHHFVNTDSSTRTREDDRVEVTAKRPSR